MSCFKCRFYSYELGCLSPDRHKCPLITSGNNNIKYPVVTKRKLFNVAYMATRIKFKHPIVLTRSEVDPPLERTVLPYLYTSELVSVGQYTYRTGCLLLVEGMPVFDLELTLPPIRKLKDGVELTPGATLFETLLFRTLIDIDKNKVLGVIQYSEPQDSSRRPRAILYYENKEKQRSLK